MESEFQVSLYFLSALSQSMAALLAIGGVFAIYQFQRIDNGIEQTCNAFRNYIRNSKIKLDVKEVDTWLSKDIKSHLLFYFYLLKKEKFPDNLSYAFVDYYSDLEEPDKFRMRLKRELWLPMITIAVAFLVSLFALIKTPSSGYNTEFLTKIFLFAVVASWALIRYIWVAIVGHRILIFNNPIISEDKELNLLRESILREKGRQMLKEYNLLKKKLKEDVIRLAQETSLSKEMNVDSKKGRFAMCCFKWAEERIRKLTVVDMALVKWCCIVFGLLLAKVWPPILSLDWYWYAVLFVILAVKPLTTVFRKS